MFQGDRVSFCSTQSTVVSFEHNSFISKLSLAINVAIDIIIIVTFNFQKNVNSDFRGKEKGIILTTSYSPSRIA